ncbi:uncharacterized protein EV420DRAFT_1644287 [Desarmillaria tabescens]|uniref:Uncharacterized protein n=1 Tax=Armillaria tabescens TaxID=1929756 RepID=A0AA39K9N0_ARMTA|nr:uncharacterized protein EV420DRAFT_1644287 [Desarmillaria tabescens]KAK0457132.1 hypothetical protein EV420DRAFT_1644287 [Desarmillaria tabescens]
MDRKPLAAKRLFAHRYAAADADTRPLNAQSARDRVKKRYLFDILPEHPQTRDKNRFVSTLDVRHIQTTDIHDLSFYKKPRVHTTKSGDSSFQIDYATDVLNVSSKYLVFPPRTEGFLYYHHQRDSLPGEVRFCLANSLDTNTGMDLLLPNGLPWSIPLWYIVSAPKYENLLRKLVADGLVSTEQVTRCKWMFPLAWARRRRRVTVLMRWNDVFAVPLDAKTVKIWIAGEKAKKEVVLWTERILGQYAGKSTGCVHARIEQDPIREVDVVNVFKVQKAAGEVPLSLNSRVKPSLSRSNLLVENAPIRAVSLRQ